MKINITDEFLWDLYNITSKVGDILNFISRPVIMSNYLPGPKNPFFDKYLKNKNKRSFSDLIYYLKINGYIKIKNLENKSAIMLTKKGINKAWKASFKMYKKEKRKDGKWVMLIFDMPEKNRKSRDLLRSILYNLGYKLFQQSVWMTPYNVSEKTEKSLQLYNLDKYVKIFLIENV